MNYSLFPSPSVAVYLPNTSIKSNSAALENAVGRVDCILSSGGVSVGEEDHVRGQVERLGPALELLPERLWLDPSSPRYGRPLRVRAAAPLLPGEAVQVAPR
jgi:molybdopterin biosynthesis enzyme